jgi:hypothetical protein
MALCDVHYSPFLKCGGMACAPFNGKHVCTFHIHQFRQNDECCICLDPMSIDERELYVISCGHMFHTSCLSKTTKPTCPLCREPMTPIEASDIYYPTVIQPLIVKLYSLPTSSIRYVLQAFELVLHLATYGQDGGWYVWYKLCRLARRMGL